MKPDGVSVSVYVLDGKVKVLAQFGLEGLQIERDETGKVKEDKKAAFQKAVEEALSNWELGNV